MHAAVVSLIWSGPLPFSPGEKHRPKNLYDLVIAPQEKKIVWYRPHDPLPPVTPQDPTEGPARGTLQSFQQSIVAEPPKAKPGRQMIWQAAPRLELEKDMKAPNLIAIAAPVAPPSQRREPKPFMPPPSQPSAAAASSLPLPSPELSPNQTAIVPAGAAVTGLPLAPKPKAKSFVPPPTGPARLPLPVPVLADAGELVLAGGGPVIGPVSAVENGIQSALRVKPQAKVFSPGSASAGKGTGAGSGAAPTIINGDAPELGGTGSNVNIAIVGLDPAARLEGALPEGGLQGQFSRAPIPGPPSAGAGAGGIRIPGLAVGESPGSTPTSTPATPERSKPSGGAAKPVYLETVLPERPTTLSAPLRPSARTIPRTVEAHFRRRIVYTLVIPIPNLPAYAGDWVLWFAERDSDGEAAPPMRAPMPIRKLEPINGSRAQQPGMVESTLQLGGVIRRDGKLGEVSIVRGVNPSVNKLAIEELQYWQFSPASRNGAMVDVDVVIEIPLRIDGRLARQ
jgi:hypothetical protein